MSYSVLIVDDEPEITAGIKFLIQRYCKDCEVVDLAYDGEEGYQKAMKWNPNAIITDIRMPNCDGLEMIKRLQQSGLKTHFLVLSGYAEFEYAKKAITLGVAEFITKPVDETELCMSLDKIADAIYSEHQELENKMSIQNNMHNYILRDFLDGVEKDVTKIKNKLQEREFPISNRLYRCVTIITEKDEDVTKIVNEELWKESLRVLPTVTDTLTVSNTLREITLILASENVLPNERLQLTWKGFQRRLYESFHVRLCIGIGLSYAVVDDIPKSFEEARCALNYRILAGNESVIFYESISDIPVDVDLITKEDIERLEESIDRLDNAAIENVVDVVFGRVSRERELSFQDLQSLSLYFVLAGIRKIPFAQLQLNNFFGKNIFSVERISKFETMEQLKHWIVNTLQSMNELMLHSELPNKRDVVQDAKEYILKNYATDISLNDISQRFFINPYYFSQLFKKKTGITYTQFLLKVRIDRAKKLLEETNLKIYEICELIGYTDVNHFNRVYERTTGIRPSEYRRKYRNN